MLSPLREQREGKLQMLLSLRENGPDALFQEVRVFKVAFFQKKKKNKEKKNREVLRADFWEGDEDSNFSVSRVRRFTDSPEPLHWIAFPVETLTKPLIHWIASPLFIENPFYSLKSSSSHPLPKIGSKVWSCVIKSTTFCGFKGGVSRSQRPVNGHEVSEHGFVYGSKLWKCRFSVNSRWRRKSLDHSGYEGCVWNPLSSEFWSVFP